MRGLLGLGVAGGVLLAAGVASAAGPASRQRSALASLPAFRSARTVVARSSAVARPSLCDERPTAGSYGWPVRPFDRAHPVRGNFGDPRTIYTSDGGRFSFHNGVDIVAAGGTAVYPVVSGTVTLARRDELVVTADDGRHFQYWHLDRSVRLGERVRARRTVLGRVRAAAGHVHLAEIRDGVVQNPLAPGHLRPYRDGTPPLVRGVAFRSLSGKPLKAESLRGTVRMVAWAQDASSLPVPAPWNGLPVAPAWVSWRLVAPPGRLVDERSAVDFRTTVPDTPAFWSVYARGSYQNAPVVRGRRPLGVPGRYLYALGTLDTGRLDPGLYVLTVSAGDVCGNNASASVRIEVAPRPESAPPPAPEPLPVAEPRAPAPFTPPPRQGEPLSWPGGRSAYTVVLASVPETTAAASAPLTARAAIAAGLPAVGLLASERFRNLTPGFRVVFSGVYRTAGEATAAAFAAASRYPGAYPRLVVPDRTRRAGRRAARRVADVVLASIPLGSGRQAALDEAARARSAGIGHVRVLRSDRLAGFRPGYWVIAGDRATAVYPTAYARRIVLLPRSRSGPPRTGGPPPAS